MTDTVTSMSYNLFALDDRTTGHLLSDHTTPGLHRVVSGELTPLHFAADFVNMGSGSTFAARFLTTPLSVEHASVWLFDQAVRMAVMWRIANLPAVPPALSQEVASDAAFYAMVTDTKDPLSWYTGLTSFRSISEAVAEYVCQDNMVLLLKALGKAVGDITDPTWLLHRPTWKQELWEDREKLQIIRRFLHAGLILAQAEVFEPEWFGVSATQVREDLLRFLDLVEDSATTRGRIKCFLNDIVDYALEHPPHPLYDLVLKAPFRTVSYIAEHYFQRANEAYQTPVPNTPMWEQDEWNCLRQLGDAFDPDLTVTTGVLPAVYTNAVVSRIHETEAQDALRGFAECRDFELRLYADGHFDEWAKAELQDNLRSTIVERRLASLCGDLEQSIALIKNSTHLLLLLDCDNEARMGLSFVDWMLGIHTAEHTAVLTEPEVEILQELHGAWTELRLDRPHHLPMAWREALAEQPTRVNLRSWLFTVIEFILLDPAVELVPLLGITREEMFHRIGCFTQWLQDPHIRVTQIKEFVAQLPSLTQSLTLSAWFLELWDFSYPAISPNPTIHITSELEDYSNHGHTLH